MTDDLKSKVAGQARNVLPWRKGIAWWLVLIQGLVLTGLGLYMFFATPATLAALGWILALTLVASGALSLYLSLQASGKTPARQWTLIHGIVGVAAGGLVILLQLLDVLSANTAATILGLGALAYGAIGAYFYFDKSLAPLRRLSVVGTVFFLVTGLLLLLQVFGLGTFVTTVQILTFAVLIAGIALIFWAFILRNSGA